MPDASPVSKKRFVMPTVLAALVIGCGNAPKGPGDSGVADSGFQCSFACPALPDGGCTGQCGTSCPDVACQRDDFADGGPACACLA